MGRSFKPVIENSISDLINMSIWSWLCTVTSCLRVFASKLQSMNELSQQIVHRKLIESTLVTQGLDLNIVEMKVLILTHQLLQGAFFWCAVYSRLI